MNCFKWAKLLVFCLGFSSTCLIFYIYSIKADFYRNGSDENSETAETEKNEKVGTARSEQSVHEKRTKDSTDLGHNIFLEQKGSHTKKWSSSAWKLIEEELHRSGTGKYGSPPEALEDIPLYTAKCLNSDTQEAKSWPKLSNGLFAIEDSNVGGRSDITAAVASLPCMLYVNRSTIYRANRGAFTKIGLPRGIIFGPYKSIKMLLFKGQYVTTRDQSSMARSGYAWALGVNYDGYLYVDAKDEAKSNWLRFINCARFEEEQNLYPVFVEGQIYYLLYKDIAPHSELLVWYGKSYGSELGLWFLSNSSAPSLAAPRSQVVCPTCRGLPSLEDVKKRFGSGHM